MLKRKRCAYLYFCGFSVGDYKGCALYLGAFYFFEGIIYTLLGNEKTECKDYGTKNDYFVDGLHIQ